MQWKIPERYKPLVSRYKPLLIAVLAGLLLLFPSSRGEDSDRARAAPESTNVTLDVSQTEQRMSAALSRIAGAGRVTVVLSVKEGTRQVLAQDIQRADGEETRKAVVLSCGSGVEQVVPLQQIGPDFQGALAVCPGGGDPTVRLQLTDAIRALTGLSADKISICKSE